MCIASVMFKGMLCSYFMGLYYHMQFLFRSLSTCCNKVPLRRKWEEFPELTIYLCMGSRPYRQSVTRRKVSFNTGRNNWKVKEFRVSLSGDVYTRTRMIEALILRGQRLLNCRAF